MSDQWGLSALHYDLPLPRNAKNQFVKLKKERDYHRMHHRRVFQEKEKVLKDIKRLKDLFSQHKEVLEKTRQKFEVCVVHSIVTVHSRTRVANRRLLLLPQNAAREKTIAQVENQRLRMTCKLLQVTESGVGFTCTYFTQVSGHL